VPNGGIDTHFLTLLNGFIRKQVAAHPTRQFFLVTGGGRTARHYIDAGRDVVGHELSNDDLDWLGIHSSRLNAHLVRTVFRDIAYPLVLKELELIHKIKEPVVVAGGWKPGWSTDYVAVQLAEDYGAETVINLSNITQVYDKDPAKHKDAKPLKKMSWPQLQKLVGNKWSPGLSMPFDPIATKKASELGLTVAIMNGKDLDNLQNYLEGREFVGTVVSQI
jgi:uridylate kinase